MTSHSINKQVYLPKSFQFFNLRLETELTNNNAINFNNFIMTKQ